MGNTDGKRDARSGAAQQQRCQTCAGSGELGTEAGVGDCPDCGGSGSLPHQSVLLEWRMRDIERSRAAQSGAAAGDIHWLIAELRRARTALTEIVTLAEDSDDSEAIRRMGRTAGKALGLIAVRPVKAK